MRRMKRSGTLLLLSLSGCYPGPEAEFTRDRALDACVQVIPACPGQYAACALDDSRYAEVTFPGAFSFIVDADPESQIEVQIFLREQRDAGFETLIYWNEPGCSDVYLYESQGRDLFAEAEDTSVIAKKQRIFEGGEHLIEIISDMQALTLVSVDVIEPEAE
jgi:hypothetical protein